MGERLALTGQRYGRLTVRIDNTSGATGINWLEDKHLWRAAINFKGKRRYLGSYRNFEDAVKARGRAEEELIEPFLREYAGTGTRNVNDNFDAVNARNRT